MSPLSGLPFVVGDTYADRVGEYTVISLEGNRIVYQYNDGDGQRLEGDATQKALIYKNILLEKKSPVRPKSQQSVNSYDNGVHFFSHGEVFPIIAAIIEAEFIQLKTYVTHEAIVSALLSKPEAQPLFASCPKDGSRTAEWWAHNMVAWFSKVFTDGRSDWNGRFERLKIDGKWAYRLPEES